MGWCTRNAEGGLPEEPPRPILERKEDDDQLDGEVVEDELVDPIDQIVRERAFFDPRVLRARTDVHRTRENDEQPEALPQDVVHHLGEENADFLVRCCSRTALQFGWGNQRHATHLCRSSSVAPTEVPSSFAVLKDRIRVQDE